MSGVSTLILEELFSYILVFTRFIALFAFMPGIGESYISARIRILLALSIAALLAPVLSPTFPPMPQVSFAFFIVLGGEIFIGFFAGALARILVSAFDIAGSMIGFQMGLANAFVKSPASSQQSSLPGVFLGIIAIVCLFITDLHHEVIRSLIWSYEIFKPGNFGPLSQWTGDLSAVVTNFVAASFTLAIQLSSPIMIVGLLTYGAAGLVNRLIPQVQVFFILQPLQMFVGFVVLLTSMTIVIPYFLGFFGDQYKNVWIG